MSIVATCPACGFQSQEIRCPRCNALKVVGCSGACAACASSCKTGAVPSPPSAAYPQPPGPPGAPRQSGDAARPSEAAAEDADHLGTPLER